MSKKVITQETIISSVLEKGLDELLNIPPKEFIDFFLKEAQVFSSDRDMRLFIIQSVGEAVQVRFSDLEFPITFDEE